MEDDLNFLGNGRQPQFFENVRWSKFFENGRHAHFFLIGRWPQSYEMEEDLILINWRRHQISSKDRQPKQDLE